MSLKIIRVSTACDSSLAIYSYNSIEVVPEGQNSFRKTSISKRVKHDAFAYSLCLIHILLLLLLITIFKHGTISQCIKYYLQKRKEKE